MNAKEEQEQRLPGMPGPTKDTLARREAARNAIRDLRRAMLPTIDTLRGQEGARICYAETIAGDRFAITITPGKEQPSA
jgi:hypothetical protein